MAQLTLSHLQLLHLLFPVRLADISIARGGWLLLPLSNLLYVLPILVLIASCDGLLVFPCHLISFLLGLQLVYFLLPDAQLVEQHSWRVVRGWTWLRRLLLVLSLEVACDLLRVLFLLDRQLLDTLLELNLCRLAFFKLVLHVAKSLNAAHRVDLLF